MTEKTGQPMYIDTLDEQHPECVLNNLQLGYSGFRVRFDLPDKRALQVEINAFAKKNGTIEVYEHLQGRATSTNYWLVQSNRYELPGTDPLPLLTACLKTCIGGIEHGYEDSFAEVILAGLRDEKECSTT